MKSKKNVRRGKLIPVMVALVLSAAFVLSGCTTGTPEATPTTQPTVEPTLAPTTEPTTDPTTEPTTDPTTEPTTDPSAESTPAPLPENVDGLASAEEVTAFLENVYATVGQENLPMMLQHTALDLTDMDAVTYNTGLTSIDGIDGIVVSESGVGSIAYSLVYIMTADGADADAIQTELMEKINPAKWVCVSAEKLISVRLGSDVLLVMGDSTLAGSVYDAVVETAQGVFTSVGEKVEK